MMKCLRGEGIKQVVGYGYIIGGGGVELVRRWAVEGMRRRGGGRARARVIRARRERSRGSGSILRVGLQTLL